MTVLNSLLGLMHLRVSPYFGTQCAYTPIDVSGPVILASALLLLPTADKRENTGPVIDGPCLASAVAWVAVPPGTPRRFSLIAICGSRRGRRMYRINLSCSGTGLMPFDIELDISRHCIETEVKKLHDRAVSAYFGNREDKATLELMIQFTRYALEVIDFSQLRTQHPPLAGNTNLPVRLIADNDALALLLNGEPIVLAGLETVRKWDASADKH
jgi:hypothetical protein